MPVYAKYFHDTLVIFNNFVITYREPLTGPSLFFFFFVIDIFYW